MGEKTRVIDIQGLEDEEKAADRSSEPKAGGTARSGTVKGPGTETGAQGKPEGTAMFKAVEDEEEEPEARPAKRRRRAKKGEMPKGWDRKKGEAAEEVEDEDEDEDEEARAKAMAEANAEALRQAAEAAGPAFSPIDLAALMVGIEAVSPTRMLLEIPEGKGVAVSERTQKLVQQRRYEESLISDGEEPEVAEAKSRAMMDESWVRVQLRSKQVEMTESICQRRIEVLAFKDPRKDIDRSMHCYSPKETTQMAREVAQLIAYYDALCDLERAQVFQVELERRTEIELAKKKKEQDSAVKDMLPKLRIDPETAKKNIKMWKKAHPEE